MGTIINDLGLDRTFFYQLAIFSLLFFLLSRLYFKPFMALFEARHKRTVADKEAAEKLMAQSQAKFDEYKQRLAEERSKTRREYESILAEAKKEESVLMTQARDESKKITQLALDSIAKQREQVKKDLEKDIEVLARSVTDQLLSRKS